MTETRFSSNVLLAEGVCSFWRGFCLLGAASSCLAGVGKSFRRSTPTGGRLAGGALGVRVLLGTALATSEQVTDEFGGDCLSLHFPACAATFETSVPARAHCIREENEVSGSFADRRFLLFLHKPVCARIFAVSR